MLANPLRKLSNRAKIWLSIVLSALIIAALAIYNEVEGNRSSICEAVETVPQMPVAIVFGAGIQTKEANDRVATAVSLYKAGKVLKLLMTGDNGRTNYNEPESMKQQAVAAGVPAQDVTCDYAGFRTYDSIYRARHIFEVTQAVLVTQRYHLPRALFLARHIGVEAVGFDAGLHKYGAFQYWYDLREIVAAEAAWLDVVTGRKPKFLGKKEPLFAPANLGKTDIPVQRSAG